MSKHVHLKNRFINVHREYRELLCADNLELLVLDFLVLIISAERLEHLDSIGVLESFGELFLIAPYLRGKAVNH